MSATPPNDRSAAGTRPLVVVHCGRDSFWSSRHVSDDVMPPVVVRKKWQCLACGNCGFVELARGELRPAVLGRIGHACRPENIVFYAPGAHQPLEE